MKAFVEKVPVVVVIASLCFVLFGIFLYHPFFGPMDDSLNLFVLAKAMRVNGFWHEVWDFTKSDIHWGMFRPTNAIMIGLLYPVGLHFGPEGLFLVNAIAVIAIVSLANYAIVKVTRLDFWKLWLLELGFFYFHDLFLYPSLQEKLVLLFGSLLLLVSHAKIPAAWRSGFIVLFTLLGVVTKASICIYLSVSFWAFFCAQKKPLRKQWALGLYFLLLLTSVLFLAWVSKQGHYTTEHYSLAKIPKNLLTREGIILFAPAALFLLLKVRKKSWKTPEIFLPALGAFSFLAIFLPWGIMAYIQTIIAPLFCALILQLLQEFLPQKRSWLWILPIALLAFGVSAYRTRTNFTRLHDMGEIVAKAKLWEQKGVQEISAPCLEGSDSLGRYFHFWANSSIRVRYLENPLDRMVDGKILFYDRSLCPLPGRLPSIPNCTEELLYSPSFPKSYRLAREKCAS